MLYKRKNSWLFKQTHLQMGKDFYEKNGGVAIVLSRFLPIFRTFAPIVAGIVRQDLRLFMLYNVLGAILWIGSLTTAGYVLGIIVPGIEEYLKYIILFLIAATSIPLIYKYLKSTDKRD